MCWKTRSPDFFPYSDWPPSMSSPSDGVLSGLCAPPGPLDA